MEQTNDDIQVIIKSSVLVCMPRFLFKLCWMGFLSIVTFLSLLCSLNKLSYSLPSFSLKFCTSLKPVALEALLHLNLSYKKEWKDIQVHDGGWLISSILFYALSPGADANLEQISVDKISGSDCHSFMKNRCQKSGCL